MNTDYMRRRLLTAGAGAAALGALPGIGVITSVMIVRSCYGEACLTTILGWSDQMP